MENIKIKRIVVGKPQANCYLIIKGKDAIMIDPGEEKEKIEKELIGLNLVGILLTHSHFDHIGALAYFEKKYHLKHNENVNLLTCEVIETRGHSKDSVTFYFPDINTMFTGDFLFNGTIGRMDLPDGSITEMKESLDKITKYPDNTIIYPGHGEKTSLGREKKNFKYYI